MKVSRPSFLGVRITFVAGVVLALSACGKYESPKPPNAEWNQHPVNAYVATLEVKGLDEEYVVSAIGHFTIENASECQPIDKRRSLGGSRHYYYERVDIPVIKKSENLYELKLYKDFFKSSDYYGLGECRWTGHPTLIIDTPDPSHRTAQRVMCLISIHTVRNLSRNVEHLCKPAVSRSEEQGFCKEIAQAGAVAVTPGTFYAVTNLIKE